jgi:dienelactone hydrolase
LVGCNAEKAEQPTEAKEVVAAKPPPDFDGEIISTSDGHWVAARRTGNNNDALGIVVMFHQSGSNMHEYDPIAPRINALGYDCLVVDQRAGGSLWGEENITASQYEGEVSYMDAYIDMQAAIEWVAEQGYKTIIAWGSSYSASLVLKLASEDDRIDAVLSFSPGEYFDDKRVVAEWNSRVDVPRFFAATADEIEDDVLDIYMAAPDTNKQVMKGFRDGIHGSSTLREDKCPQRYEDYWKGVEEFFAGLNL